VSVRVLQRDGVTCQGKAEACMETVEFPEAGLDFDG
jgi:hypothetical protein